MSVYAGESHTEKRTKVVEQTPGVQIFLQPIAPPAALGLAGFAGSTWITSSYIANWWGNTESPTIFFPFVSSPTKDLYATSAYGHIPHVILMY